MRTSAARDDAPSEEREIHADADDVARALRRFADLGIDHLQVQLRTNSIEGVAAFARVLDILHDER